MKYYIAAPWDCKYSARQIRRILQGAGHVSVSSWIDGGSDDWETDAAIDLEEVRSADALIAYVPDPDTSSGGRDTELGAALALGKKCVVVGVPRNVFHWHPAITRFDTISEWANNMLPEVKDSGNRQEFETGSVRDSEEGKGWYAHISPIALERLAKLLEAGGRKYGDRNWEKGQPLARFVESALRHLFRYLEGHRDEDHLAAAMWNVHGLIHVEEMIKRGALPTELNNLPNYIGD